MADKDRLPVEADRIRRMAAANGLPSTGPAAVVLGALMVPRPSPTAQRPVDQAAIDPPKAEGASGQMHERVDVRAGVPD